MTAEIAVLNKTAVALAADSAMTISVGQKQEKIFDTADKLFELSLIDPIGIMIYNGMSFMGIPLPVIIKEFRAQCNEFNHVKAAGEAFLHFLQDIGKRSPKSIHDLSIGSVVQPILEKIVERFREELLEKVEKLQNQPASDDEEGADGAKAVDTSDVLIELAQSTFENVVGRMEKRISKLPKGTFVGGGPLTFSKGVNNQIREIVDQTASIFPEIVRPRVVKLMKAILASAYFSPGRTGFVIAGFGRKEKFPTLISYESDGMVSGKLKFRQSNFHDIDREGDRAVVLPFAQKEMVDRFLYGLDEEIQDSIQKFCKATVRTISDSILDALNFANEEDKQKILESARKAESTFVASLKSKGFRQIIATSKSEIEDMVEFMPKPELAKMAEALIDLTSIKRRVSKGMETVGGPVDVAVISKSEGFVWIKRKHYFPAELNVRFFDRMKPKRTQPKEDKHGKNV